MWKEAVSRARVSMGVEELRSRGGGAIVEDERHVGGHAEQDLELIEGVGDELAVGEHGVLGL